MELPRYGPTHSARAAASAQKTRHLYEGLKESSRPGVLGLALLSIGLSFVAIGIYRAGKRELDAMRG